MGSKWPKRVATFNSKHPIKYGRVTVPHPRKDIPYGTLKSIEKAIGLKLG
jgi:predicted RNA binding protein YcfA (HicA-like mRNA interferase family)